MYIIKKFIINYIIHIHHTYIGQNEHKQIILCLLTNIELKEVNTNYIEYTLWSAAWFI